MSTHTQTSSGFKWLNTTQFLGALNDNVFKLLVIFYGITLMGNTNRAEVIAMASGFFVLPFLLFSHAAGILADKVSKQKVIILSKVFETTIMIFGCIAIYAESPVLLFTTIFLMSTQSAIFSPSKYGIIPELVTPEKLPHTNALLVGATYLAVILGAFAPSWLLLNVLNKNYLLLGICCVGIAIAGTLTSLKIPKTKVQNPNQKLNPFFLREIIKTMRIIHSDKELFMAVIGSAFFSFVAVFIQQNILVYAKDCLGLDWIASGYLFPVVALGIGAGAFFSSRLSGRQIEFGIVPMGAILLTISTILLGILSPSRISTATLLIIVGLGSGLFIVPLNAFIQHRSPHARRGQILATGNFISFLSIAISVAYFFILSHYFGLTAKQNFAMIGILTGSLTIIAICILPDFLIRLIAVLIAKMFYKIKLYDIKNLPTEGGAVLAPNHVSYVDTLLLSAATQRRIQFIMARQTYENKKMKPLYKLMGVIPISPNDPPRIIMQSLKNARKAVESGRLVCIFPEGALTRTGHMRPFKHGLEKIIKGTGCPIIPIYIGGAWGSFFSHSGKGIMNQLPTKIPYPIRLQFGTALPTTATTAEVESAVHELEYNDMNLRKNKKRTLPTLFTRRAHSNWNKMAMAQSDGQDITYGKTLISSIALAAHINKQIPDCTYIGVAVPPSIGGALTNLAIILDGRIPVNLNVTSSIDTINSCIKQCGINTIITSEKLLEKIPDFQPDAKIICLEKLIPQITTLNKVMATIHAIFIPAHRITSTKKTVKPDDPATVLFSSGSTGNPKGILLSHHNIISDIETFGSVMNYTKKDTICGMLPFFHSFGFTATLWVPLLMGVPVIYHPNPMDSAAVVNMVRDKKISIMLSTPTFLLSYIRKAKKEDFTSLRLIITGAEKLSKKLADKFEEKFGVRPLEGYGATELSPVACVNVRNAKGRAPQKGNKDGSIGMALPGILAKIVDPDTGEELPNNTTGLLLIKGANVMLGYLNDPKKTESVMTNGWYKTGDIAKIDKDGFVFIADRLSRYSKIGGEMVPHISIEELVHNELNIDERVIFVTGIPDEKKGEKLIVLYRHDLTSPDQIQKIITASTLPNLWRPRPKNYFPIDEFPTIGTGKLDLKKLRNFAKTTFI